MLAGDTNAWLTLITATACTALLVSAPWTYPSASSLQQVAAPMIVLYLAGNTSEVFATVPRAVTGIQTGGGLHDQALDAQRYQVHTSLTLLLIILVLTLMLNALAK